MVRRSAIFLLAALAGCNTYRPQPLDEAGIVRREDAARMNPPLLARAPDAGEGALASRPAPADLPQVLAWMNASAPELREARAEYATAAAVARTPTPFPNPSLSAGFLYGTGSSVTAHRWQPQAGLGVSIPLNDRLRLQDRVNKRTAEAAWIEIVARYREAYLGVRQTFARLAVARGRQATLQDLRQLAERSEAAGRQLVEAGGATAFDVGLFGLERIRVEAAMLDAEIEEAGAAGDLSRRTGVHHRAFAGVGPDLLPPLPDVLPAEQGLKDRLIQAHPGLSRLRALYAVAESELRLEVAKQWPDLNVGFSGEGDPGEKKTVLGLALGMDLPVFDRNQQAVARACQRREEVRTKYEATANSALANVERAYRGADLALRRLRLLRTQMLPMAKKQMDLALRLVEAGPGEALRVLESQRTYRTAVLDAIEADAVARRNLIELEQAIGSPLFAFPGEDFVSEETRPVSGGRKEEVR